MRDYTSEEKKSGHSGMSVEARYGKLGKFRSVGRRGSHTYMAHRHNIQIWNESAKKYEGTENGIVSCLRYLCFGEEKKFNRV